jgi:hypothetical protein
MNSVTPPSSLEPLECRSLFAVTLGADPTRADGVLTFFGSPEADHITVTRSDTLVAPTDPSGETFILQPVGDGGFFDPVTFPLSPGDAAALPAGPYAVISYEGEALRYFCPQSAADRIVFDVGAGDDEVLITPSLPSLTTLIGSRGNDFFTGGARFTVMYGGPANDYLRAVGSGAFLHGESGDDVIVGTNRGVAGTVVNELHGGGGNDTITARGLADAWIDGFFGDDHIAGGAGNDILAGLDGNDFITGGIGNDSLFGGIGADTLQGASGNDSFLPGPGKDLASGGQGNDTFDLGDGFVDRAFGEDGVDTISDSDGDDVIDLGLQ